MRPFRSRAFSFLLKTLSVWPSWKIKGFFCFTQNTGKIIKELENLNVNIDNIELFNQTGRENLEDFVNSGIEGIDYPLYLKEVWARYTCMMLGEKLGYHTCVFLLLLITTVDSHSIKVSVLKASSLVTFSIVIVSTSSPSVFPSPTGNVLPKSSCYPVPNSWWPPIYALFCIIHISSNTHFVAYISRFFHWVCF